jgi:hypothetical protein
MKTENEVKLNEDGVTLEEVMADDCPRIYIHGMKDNPDGSCTITFDTNKAFNESYKKAKGRKRVTQKGIGNYILELFQKGLDKEDGYDLKSLKNLNKLPPEGCSGGHY